MFELTNQNEIAILKMNHGKVNAMDIEFCRELSERLNQLAESNCRAVVFSSCVKVFSAGVDLFRLLKEPKSYVNHFMGAIEECFHDLFEFPKPLVAAINGHAVAGGCVMAAACDYRLIAERAMIGVPELRVGVPFPPIAMETMRFVASPQSFQAMINLGATYHDAEATSVGLADRVVESPVVLDSAIEVAQQLLAVPAEVFRMTKQQARLPALRNVLETEKKFGDQIHALWNSSEIRNTIQDYVDRRFS